MTAAKQPGHFSTKNAASQSWSSTSSLWPLIPQATAPVVAATAWVGPTGAVLADRKTPSGRCANDGTCSNCSAPTLYRMCGPPPSESQQHPPTCPACPSRLSSARASPAAARPDGLLLADEPEPGTSPAVKTGRIATAGTPVRTARRRPGQAGRRGGNRAFQLLLALLSAAGVAAVLPWQRVLQARVVQVRHRAGGRTAWRQPSRAPRQSLPAVTVMACFVWGGAALHRPLAPPQPVQLCRQRPGAVLQIQQVAVAVERPAVDAARPAAPIAGLRGARTGVVGFRPAAAVVALVEPRAGRDADLPRPARRPAGHKPSPPLAFLPGSDQPTKPASTAKPEPHCTRSHRTPRRSGLPGTVWAGGNPTTQRPAHPRPRVPAAVRVGAGASQGLGIVRGCPDSRRGSVWGECETGTNSSDHVGVNAHDPAGCPCLPPHHRVSPPPRSGWARPSRWHLTSAAACLTTSPRSPTPGSGAADGTRWARCWPLRSPPCWPAPDPWPRSASGQLTRPGRSWPRSGRDATHCAGSGGHPARRPCAACWPASTLTR